MKSTTMVEAKVNSDAASEKYRKYIVRLHYRKSYVYILCGADLAEKNQDDKLLIDSANHILAFKSIPQLQKFVTSSESVLFDPGNTVLWANSYNGKQPYCTYYLDDVFINTQEDFALSELNEEQALEIVYFINLFGDYACQTREKMLLNLHRERNVRTFFDYTYDNYVWDDPEYLAYRRLNELDYFRFNTTGFAEVIVQMLTIFIDRVMLINSYL